MIFALSRLCVAAAFVFQWQKGNQVQVLPVGASGSKAATYPKPNWGS